MIGVRQIEGMAVGSDTNVPRVSRGDQLLEEERTVRRPHLLWLLVLLCKAPPALKIVERECTLREPVFSGGEDHSLREVGQPLVLGAIDEAAS